MGLLRIVSAKPLEGYRVQLGLTDGSTIERDVGGLLVGPVFDEVRKDSAVFRAVRVEAGTLVWPNGADLCPDVVIWGGSPPSNVTARPAPGSPENSIRG